MSLLLPTAIGMTRHFRHGKSNDISRSLAVVRSLHDVGIRDGSIFLAAVLRDALIDAQSLEEMDIRLQAIRRVCGAPVAAMVRTLTRDAVQKGTPSDALERRYIARMRYHAIEHPGIVLIVVAGVFDELRNAPLASAAMSASIEQLRNLRTMFPLLPPHLAAPCDRLFRQCALTMRTRFGQ